MCLHDHQDAHAVIRQSVACHIRDQATRASAGNRATLLQRAADVSKNKSWPGEDVIIASASCLQRVIHVYVAGGPATPHQYEPSIKPADVTPLLLALYEPGHYRALTQNHLDNISPFPNTNSSLNM